jgi:hypothetical protein
MIQRSVSRQRRSRRFRPEIGDVSVVAGLHPSIHVNQGPEWVLIPSLVHHLCFPCGSAGEYACSRVLAACYEQSGRGSGSRRRQRTLELAATSSGWFVARRPPPVNSGYASRLWAIEQASDVESESSCIICAACFRCASHWRVRLYQSSVLLLGLQGRASLCPLHPVAAFPECYIATYLSKRFKIKMVVGKRKR